LKTEQTDTLLDLVSEAFAPVNTRLDKLETDMLSCFSDLSRAFKEMQIEQQAIRSEQAAQTDRIAAVETKLANLQKQIATNSWDLQEITETQLKLDGNIETLALRSLAYETELRKMKRIKLSSEKV